jgi:hypothetical protein
VNFKGALDFLKLSASALENWIYMTNLHTFENWLCRKPYPGLKYIKLRGVRRFRKQDLVTFMESWACTTTADPDNGKKFFQGEAFMKNNGTVLQERRHDIFRIIN